VKDEPDFVVQGDLGRTTFIDIADLVPRPVRADEIPELRSIYWRQARLGHRLPAELDIIVIEGGRT
jgi:hypothetical protein